MAQIDHRSIFQILHARSICETTRPPTPTVGTPVTARSRSVTCVCGQAGTLAAQGHEEEVRNAWALRNGYTLSKVDGRWVVKLPQGGLV